MSAAGAADKVFELIDRVPDISAAGDLEPQGAGGAKRNGDAVRGKCSDAAPVKLDGGSSGHGDKRGGGGRIERVSGGGGFVGSIVFERVSLFYPSRPETQVLKRISFSIEPGQVVALVGESGSGLSRPPPCLRVLRANLFCVA